jgi:hypothetical protein
MATSGTFTGARGSDGNGPYLTLAWSRIATDITNNKSQIRLTLNLVSDHSLYFSASKTGVLYGTSFTYSSGFSGTGTVTLKTLDVWVNHNSDGSLTTTFDGSFNIAVSWTTYISSLSVSGSATIDTIPRASKPTMSSTNFNMGSTVTIYTNKVSAAFTHTLTYIFGSDTVNIAFGAVDSFAWAVPLSLANQIPSATAGIGSMVCSTYNGNTLIGQESIGFTANVPSTVVPTASGLSVAISGTGRDKTLAKYVQSISKVVASFAGAGTYGSTISTSSITVKRQSDNGNSQTISGTSGTTANPVSLSGVYVITGTVTDSRGRTASVSATITVDAYAAPNISKFTASRGTPTTSVLATITASWSLGTSNPTTVTAKGKNNVGTEVTLYTLTNSTAGTITTSPTWASQSDASSYTYTLTVTDSFGNVATAVVTVGTTFVEMTISKGSGIGVGKVWERGALDVAGDIYQNNKKLIDLIYPVGAVFISVVSTSPATLFGGTWSAFATGRTLVGIDTADTAFDTVQETGGEKTHLLSAAEMPSHSHQTTANGGYYFYGGPGGSPAQGGGYGTQSNTLRTDNQGGGAVHNNLQPYIVVYMWKRTA